MAAAVGSCLPLSAVFCIGLGAWVAVSGIFAELPLLVDTQPEGWALASRLTLAVQAGNLFAFSIAGALHLGWLQESARHLGACIGCALLVAALACTALIWFYDHTTRVGGDEPQSITLLALTCIASICDGSTTITFAPYLAHLALLPVGRQAAEGDEAGALSVLTQTGQRVTQALYVGSGFSGLLPSMVSWIQMPRHDQRNFGPPYFFLSLALQMVLSMLGLGYVSFLLKGRQHPPTPQAINHPEAANARLVHGDSEADLMIEEREPLLDAKTPALRPATFMAHWPEWSLFVGASILLNAALPAVLSYAAGRYGGNSYHTAQTLLLTLNPVASFVPRLHGMVSRRFHGLALAVSAALTAYVVAIAVPTAAAGPEALLHVAVAASCFLSQWIQTSLLSELLWYQQMCTQAYPRLLFWAGVMVQAGAAVGALLFYVLVNHTSIFAS